ncbi:hypothetical protein BaRGS_00009449 [Batillaria attramentaria]|uniref:LRRCT domain-containing protein n=1 Tax=Batillaria attramentaria TaxID=370345 RepID=A0ABD0LI19_9CAEN
MGWNGFETFADKRLDLARRLKLRMLHLDLQVALHTLRFSLRQFLVCLWAILSWSVSLTTACSSVCTCTAVIIDCAGKQLQSLPVIRSDSKAAVVNISYNNLAYLKNGDVKLPVHSVLDLSGNKISFVPVDFFGAETFSRLGVLNFTHNSLTDLGFNLPQSLKVLKLSYNNLRCFSVSILQDLTQLKTLYVDFNNLATVTAGENNTKKKSTLTEECPFPPLQNIQEVSFQGNKLATLDPSVIRCFQNAQYLSLADNNLETIPPKTFSTFRHLKFLDLSRNHLRFLLAGVFTRLTSLKFLSLSGNRLETVPAGLPMMEWLDLSYNAITTVTDQQKGDLYPQEIFLLGSNPLHCDCQLLWLKELFDTREYLLKYVTIDKNKFVPVCASPSHIRGDTWDVLGDESFGCKDAALQETSDTKDEEVSVVRLDDLSIRVQEVGPNYVMLEWDSLNLLTSSTNPADMVERNKVFISFHPFGKKLEKVSVSVHLVTGSYRLKALHPGTAYVICMSLTDPSSRNPHAKIQRDDCVEIVTKSNDVVGVFLKEHYVQVALVVLICLLLLVKCCCQTPRPAVQKEKSS